MNNVELALSKSMDRDAEAQNEAENAKASEGVQERLRTSGLDVTGPSSDDYDYIGADRAGTPFTPVEEGGVNLPNKYNQNRYVAGRRVSDGIKVHDRNDPNGFGAEGFKRMQESYINTETGAPAEAMDAVVPLMAEHIQNGGTLEDFDDPTGMGADAYATLKATATISGIVQELRTIKSGADQALEDTFGPITAPPVPAGEGPPSLTLEDVGADPEFVTAARVIRQHFGLDEKKSGGDEAIQDTFGTGDEEELDDAGAAEDLIEEMAALTSSAWKMGSLIYSIESGDMSPETQAAYAYAFDVYDRFTPWSMDVLQGGIAGIFIDAPMYAAGGGLGMLAAKLATKKVMVQTVMKLLAKNQVKATMAVGATAGAVESGGFGALEEATRQKVSGEENFGKVWQAGANNAIAGAVLMTPFSALLVKPGREFVKRAYHSIADKIGGDKTPINAKNDWMTVSDSETYRGVPEELEDLGVPMADSSGSSYYSRLYREAVEGGLIGNKETDPLQYLAVIQKRKASGAFKANELQSSKLVEFLQGKSDAGETVNKDIVDDYLWANRPQVNSLLSSAFDFTGPASERLKSGKDAIGNLRKEAAHNVVKNNFYKVEEMVDANGLQSFRVTNKYTKESEITNDVDVAINDQTLNMLGDLSDDQVVGLVRRYDREALLGPPRYGKDVKGKGSPTIIKGHNENNYQELRIMLAYGGMDNADDIAVDRFGAVYKDLTEREQKRVGRIRGFAAERKPVKSFRDDKHYPLEHNILVAVRTQTLFQPQNGGQRVLAVNEFQSDLHETMKKTTEEDTEFFIDSSTDYGFEGMDVPGVERQGSEGWLEMAVNRTLQMAEKQGYNKVAIPVHPGMIQSIQLWSDDKISQKVLRIYRQLGKSLQNDKKLWKTWGIESVQLEDVSGAANGQSLPQQMMVITFDPTKSKGAKPIYGIGAISGAGGAMNIDAKSEEE